MIKERHATSRISFKQPTKSGDVFYTFEFGEVHTNEDGKIPEAKELWDIVNAEVNKQILEVKELYK